MISTSDFKKGVRYEQDGAPWQVMEFSVHNPTARGGTTLIKAKVRNLKTGQVMQKTYKTGELFQEPDLVKRAVQYLYHEGEGAVFMDKETYDQFTVENKMLEDAEPWLNEELELELLQYNGQVINVELPQYLSAVVQTVEAGAKGDTASGKVTARAFLENGVQINVPTFIKEGQRIKLDPTTKTYHSRL